MHLFWLLFFRFAFPCTAQPHGPCCTALHQLQFYSNYHSQVQGKICRPASCSHVHAHSLHRLCNTLQLFQERGVVAWSPQVWKRKVLLDSSTKSSEKPWYNAHLALTPVRGSMTSLHVPLLSHATHAIVHASLKHNPRCLLRQSYPTQSCHG